MTEQAPQQAATPPAPGQPATGTPAPAQSPPPAPQERGLTQAVASNYDPQPTAHQQRLVDQAEEFADARAQQREELRQIGEKEGK